MSTGKLNFRSISHWTIFLFCSNSKTDSRRYFKICSLNLRFWVERWMYWFYNDVFFIFIFIFVSIATVWGSKTALIFFNGILFDGKVNLVGAFRRSKCYIVFQSARKYKTKIKEKHIIFTQNRFSTKSILVFGITLRQIT